ncbi:AraC family transcriptional regulator [Plasticicumulans acidivorans]|uniref:AraC-like DNA-binding protein n=1 Tax=Plasticicumulans acidivorans TaxID=886464 RepID=A0A317MZA4_9GAMM|nr:AraC family transcriptional regulator [Plasticicumulans acidivorans]PWV65602.1 AraC-like DNA-binding protein [Plasticicumulans acidivorans]
MAWQATPEGPSEHPNPEVLIGRIDVDDFSLWEQTTAPWELLAKLLDTHSFHNHKDYLVTPSVVLYQESYSSCLRAHGLTPAHMLTLSVPLRTGARTVYWNTGPQANGLPIALPGGVDAVVDAGQSHLILLVSLPFLQQHLAGECLSQLMHAAAVRFLIDAPERLENFGRWLQWVLEQALTSPEAFRHRAVVHSFEQDLLQRLSRLGTDCVPAAPRADMARSQRGLQRALEYLRTSNATMVTVSELCRVAGISERSLQYAFHAHVGLSPLSFIRHWRLHAARRELLAVDSSETRVADVAHRLGFVELGRFAAHYRSLFGELPSQTIARPKIRVGRPLIAATPSGD